MEVKRRTHSYESVGAEAGGQLQGSEVAVLPRGGRGGGVENIINGFAPPSSSSSSSSAELPFRKKKRQGGLVQAMPMEHGGGGGGGGGGGSLEEGRGGGYVMAGGSSRLHAEKVRVQGGDADVTVSPSTDVITDLSSTEKACEGLPPSGTFLNIVFCTKCYLQLPCPFAFVLRSFPLFFRASITVCKDHSLHSESACGVFVISCVTASL